MQPRFDTQPRRGSCMTNERDHRFKRAERTTAPILSDVTEEAMLDLVPLAGARWEMRDVNPEAQVVGQPLQFLLPRARAITVAAARIGGDEQRVRLRIRRAAHHRVLSNNP